MPYLVVAIQQLIKSTTSANVLRIESAWIPNL